jgi:hypothetical protein
MSNKIIINTRDGSVIELRDSVIVDLDKLTDEQNALWDEWIEGANDTTACELGRQAGKDLYGILSGCGFGDLNYGNSIAYSPLGVRDEIQAKLDSLKASGDTDELLEQASKWTQAELEEFGSYAIQSEYLWQTWNEDFTDNLRSFIAHKKQANG